MVEPWRLGLKAEHQVPEALPVGKLAETHAQELVPTGKAPYTAVPLIPGDALCKVFRVDEGHNLGEYIFS